MEKKLKLITPEDVKQHYKNTLSDKEISSIISYFKSLSFYSLNQEIMSNDKLSRFGKKSNVVKTNQTNRAVIYLRVSSLGQVDNL